jgi:quinol monooxygenase YgiN
MEDVMVRSPGFFLAVTGNEIPRPKQRVADGFVSVPGWGMLARAPACATPGGIAMIHVLAVITTKPGKRAEVLEMFHANMPAVHAEAGCIEYGPVIDAPNSPAKYGDDTFVVVEKWESPDHLKAHAASPHMAAYGAKTKELLADRQIHIMQNG